MGSEATQFKPDQPKMGGRRKGSRNRISAALMEALAEDFEAHGAEAIKITRVEKPSEYLKICASLIPHAFEDEAPLQVTISQITRTIVDPKDHAFLPLKTGSMDDEAAA
jgi:hypothetical protein